MKKIIAVVVVVVSLFAAAFVFWLNQPAATGEQQVAESVSAAKNRFAQTQREADNADLNGYISEEFLPLWGSGRQKGEVAPVKQTVIDWVAFADEDTDHEALLANKDEKYMATRQAFEALLPSLVATMNKRLFVVPRPALSSFATPDAGSLRMLAQAINGYVRSKTAEGQPTEAVAPVAALFSLGGKMQGRETLSNDLMGITLQRAAFEALALIPGDAKLSAEDWLALGTAVNHGIPPKDQMSRAFEAEVGITLENIQQNEKEAAESGSYLDRLFLQREKRIFINQTAVQLEALKGGKLPDYQYPEPSTSGFLTGETGTIALLQVSDFLRARDIMDFHREALILTAAAMDLRAYRAKNGKLPETMDKLSEMGLTPPEGPIEYSPEQETILMEIPADSLQNVDAKDFTLPGWSEVTDKGLKLFL